MLLYPLFLSICTNPYVIHLHFLQRETRLDSLLSFELGTSTEFVLEFKDCEVQTWSMKNVAPNPPLFNSLLQMLFQSVHQTIKWRSQVLDTAMKNICLLLQAWCTLKTRLKCSHHLYYEQTSRCCITGISKILFYKCIFSHGTRHSIFSCFHKCLWSSQPESSHLLRRYIKFHLSLAIGKVNFPECQRN